MEKLVNHYSINIEIFSLYFFFSILLGFCAFLYSLKLRIRNNIKNKKLKNLFLFKNVVKKKKSLRGRTTINGMEITESEKVIQWWWDIIRYDFIEWKKDKEKKLLEGRNYNEKIMSSKCYFFVLSREFFLNSRFMVYNAKKTWETYENKDISSIDDLWVEWLWRFYERNPSLKELWDGEKEIETTINKKKIERKINEIELIRIWKRDIKNGNDNVYPDGDMSFVEKYYASEEKLIEIKNEERKRKKSKLDVLKMKWWLSKK